MFSSVEREGVKGVVIVAVASHAARWVVSNSALNVCSGRSRSLCGWPAQARQNLPCSTFQRCTVEVLTLGLPILRNTRSVRSNIIGALCVGNLDKVLQNGLHLRLSTSLEGGHSLLTCTINAPMRGDAFLNLCTLRSAIFPAR